ncbi:hypothetical protein V1517DRAFT_325463, partial [Lipomyces orientalis]
MIVNDALGHQTNLLFQEMCLAATLVVFRTLGVSIRYAKNIARQLVLIATMTLSCTLEWARRTGALVFLRGGPLALWRCWANRIEGYSVEGGRFFPEMCPGRDSVLFDGISLRSPTKRYPASYWLLVYIGATNKKIPNEALRRNTKQTKRNRQKDPELQQWTVGTRLGLTRTAPNRPTSTNLKSEIAQCWKICMRLVLVKF